MTKLQVVVWSTRPTRNAERVLAWAAKRAEEHGGFEVEVLDLRDWPLPIFQEHRGTIGDFNDPAYSEPIVKRWNQKLKEGDAYLFVTPEYNHSVPGVLKNAIDNVFVSWALRNKLGGFVGYSTRIAGGVRAIEHLALIGIEAELVPLRNTVLIPKVEAAFTEAGRGVSQTPATKDRPRGNLGQAYFRKTFEAGPNARPLFLFSSALHWWQIG